jgi:hypothetical protein
MRSVARGSARDSRGDAQNDNVAGECGAGAALAAMQHPEISAAINAAILSVLQRYDTSQSSRATSTRPDKRSVMKPVVKNNLFIITVIWTIIGLFLLYGAVQSSNINTEIAIFAIYGIVQLTLVAFTVIVTSKQVQKVYKRSITLGFLLQGWFALVLSFAGTYLFLQNAYSLGVVTLSNTEELAVCSRMCAPLAPTRDACTAADRQREHQSDRVPRPMPLVCQPHRV